MKLDEVPLVKFAEKLGIDSVALSKAEETTQLLHTYSISGEACRSLAEGDIESLRVAYGTAFYAEIRGDGAWELKIDKNYSTEQLENFKKNIDRAATYEVVLDLNKTDVVQQWLPDSLSTSSWRVLWFLFAATMARQLQMGLAHFEEEVWKEDTSRLLVLVSDTELEARGRFLYILGDGHIDHYKDVIGTPEPDWPLVKHVADARDRYISWDRTWVRFLTPLHFEITWNSGEGSQVAELLARQIVVLTILYTCDRARLRTSSGSMAEIRAEYRGENYSTVIVIDESVSTKPPAASFLAKMHELISWCYRQESGELQRDWVQNRLPFVQTRIADVLMGVEEPRRLQAFVSFLPYLLEGLEAHWRAFIEERIAEYLGKVRELESLISGTVAKFSEQTAALTKGLSEAILAAVAVLVGSFIAAALASPFNSVLFTISVLVYGGYIFVGPLLVGLGSQWGLFRSWEREYTSQAATFRSLMHGERIDELVGDRVAKAKALFWLWFWLAFLGYLLLVGAAVFGAYLVPSLV